jgi:ABC-type branched-subunit amino acid transport system permease subunit
MKVIQYASMPPATAVNSADSALLFAILIGLPVLRLKGHYFAIATLGLSAAVAAIISNLDIAGANNGLILPLARADTMFYELALALLVSCTLSRTPVWKPTSSGRLLRLQRGP